MAGRIGKLRCVEDPEQEETHGTAFLAGGN